MQRVVTEDVQRRLLMIRSHSALKFRRDKGSFPPTSEHKASRQVEAAEELRWRQDRCSDIQHVHTPALKAVAERKGQTGLEQKEGGLQGSPLYKPFSAFHKKTASRFAFVSSGVQFLLFRRKNFPKQRK